MRALSRKKAHRTSLIRNLATSLILFESIKTTVAKAKELKPFVEHLINKSKSQDLNARRNLLAVLFDENATEKVLEDLVPRYKNIKTGFIKSYKLGTRLGDNAEMMMLQLVKGEEIVPDNKEEEKDAKASKNTRKAGK